METTKNICVSGMPHEILASLEEAFEDICPSTKLDVVVGDSLTGSGTRGQKALYWIWIAELSKDTGYTNKELDVLLRELFLPAVVEDADGPRPKSVSEMSTRELSDLLDQVNRWAGEMFGVELKAERRT